MRPDTQETPDLVTFTKEIFNRKLHFLCSENEKLLSKWLAFIRRIIKTPEQEVVMHHQL